jgi:rsbT co-antagonist protein RsbR
VETVSKTLVPKNRMKSVQPIRVLLIDDDPKERQLTQGMLAQAEGTAFDVESARRLSEGLARLGEDEFDAVLLDHSLPDSQWPDTLVKVRDKAPDVPVVVLRDPKDGSAAEILAQGAQDSVPKQGMNSSVLTHCLTHAIERNSMRKESRYSDRHFRALIENSSDGIVIVDAQGNGLYNSPSFKRVLGYGQDENIGASSFGFLHPDDLPQAITYLSELTRNPGATVNLEIRGKHKDGSWHHLEATATNHLQDPAVGGIVVNIRDVTERKSAQEQFRLEMELYKQLTEHAMDGLMVIAADTTLLYQSPATERQYGIKADDRTGQIGLDFVHPDDMPTVMEINAKSLLLPDGVPHVAECRIKHSDGSWHWVSSVGINYFSDPVIKGMILINRDITARRQMEDALKKSQQELRQAMQKLQQVLNERSTPVIQVWNNVLALPLIGAVDNQRAQQTMALLLKTIVDTQSELVILDVTGVPSMDTTATNHLVRTVRSASMLGAQCVLTGMKPELAHAVIELDLDISRFIIKRDMQEGLHWALEKMGYQPTSTQSPTTEATVTYQPSETE